MMTEEDFIFATVTKYDSKTGDGTATYLDKEDGETKKATFKAADYEVLIAGLLPHTLRWMGTQGMHQEEPQPVIAFTELDMHDKMIHWANEAYVRERLVWARSELFNLYDDGICVWEGHLTTKGELHGTSTSLPMELGENMYFERFVPGDEEFDGEFSRVSDEEAPRIWQRILKASHIRTPERV